MGILDWIYSWNVSPEPDEDTQSRLSQRSFEFLQQRNQFRQAQEFQREYNHHMSRMAQQMQGQQAQSPAIFL